MSIKKDAPFESEVETSEIFKISYYEDLSTTSNAIAKETLNDAVLGAALLKYVQISCPQKVSNEAIKTIFYALRSTVS